MSEHNDEQDTRDRGQVRTLADYLREVGEAGPRAAGESERAQGPEPEAGQEDATLPAAVPAPPIVTGGTGHDR